MAKPFSATHSTAFKKLKTLNKQDASHSSLLVRRKS